MITATTGTAVYWEELDRELEIWRRLGRPATFWWRDDDAVADDIRLARLLELSQDIPLALAVVPAEAAPDLAARLAVATSAMVIQHGWSHTNHAPTGAKKAELGADRPLAVMSAELAAGWRRLKTLFGTRALPVLAPPWNRIADTLLPKLPALGFAALSTYGARPSAQPVPGLLQLNAHIDLIEWRGSKEFIGSEAAVGAIVAHLMRRRHGAVDGEEPTGLLTHHLRHDGATEDFLALLTSRLRRHEALRWVAIGDVFAVP